MKYVSIDVETTGIHPEANVIEFGAVVGDTESDASYEDYPSFRRVIIHDRMDVSPEAASMHYDIFMEMQNKGGEVIHVDSNLMHQFNVFLENNGWDEEEKRINVVGKNFMAFDDHYLRKFKGWRSGTMMGACRGYFKIRPSNRCIDPAILYFREGDESLPSFVTCKERCGYEFDSNEYSHRADKDALEAAILFEEGLK